MQTTDQPIQLTLQILRDNGQVLGEELNSTKVINGIQFQMILSLLKKQMLFADRLIFHYLMYNSKTHKQYCKMHKESTTRFKLMISSFKQVIVHHLIVQEMKFLSDFAPKMLLLIHATIIKMYMYHVLNEIFKKTSFQLYLINELA